jgi:hypothetical protein
MDRLVLSYVRLYKLQPQCQSLDFESVSFYEQFIHTFASRQARITPERQISIMQMSQPALDVGTL